MPVKPDAKTELFFPPASADAQQVFEIWNELRERWRRGDQCAASDYLTKYPTIASSAETAVDLIYAEFILRQEAGQSPQVEDFLSRYPQYAEALRRQMEIDAAIGADTARDASATISAPEYFAATKAAECPSLLGKYRVVERLDGGGQADVYRAVHPTLRKDVVIKLGRRRAEDDAAHADHLLAEGRILADLEHPHLARIYDLDFHDGRPMLVMEYLRGVNLAQFARQQPLTPRHAAQIVAKLADALALVHRHGIVHYDIKPQNVVVDERGEPRLLDFGLARRDDAWSTMQPELGGITGTVEYMAPEQARGESQRIGAASDIFALGGVLYFLLAGRSPFGPGTISEVLGRAQRCDFNREALNSARVPGRVRAICLRAMAAEPEARYASAAQFAAALQSYVRPIWKSRSGAAVAVLSLALLGGGLWRMLPRHAPPAPVAGARSEVPATAALKVQVWRKSRYRDLVDATPVRTADRLRVAAQIPPEMHGSIWWRDPDGALHELAAAAPSDKPQTLQYPPAADQAAPLTGAGGTELVVACARRSGRVTAADVQAWLGDRLAWPALPPDTVLRLAPAAVAVEQASRGLGSPEAMDDPEGQVRQRLETLRRELGNRLELFEGLAFSHQP